MFFDAKVINKQFKSLLKKIFMIKRVIRSMGLTISSTNRLVSNKN